MDELFSLFKLYTDSIFMKNPKRALLEHFIAEEFRKHVWCEWHYAKAF